MLLTDLIRTIIFFIVTINPFSQCMNQLKKFRKFRDVLSSGSHETGGTAKK